MKGFHSDSQTPSLNSIPLIKDFLNIQFHLLISAAPKTKNYFNKVL